MKRYIMAKTYYSVPTFDTGLGINENAYFPGFTLQEAVEEMESSGYLQKGYVPMTSKELNNFIHSYRYRDDENETVEDVYDRIKDKLEYTKFMNDPDNYDDSIRYSFWAASAFDLRSSVTAYGADFVGDYQFNPNRIAKGLGERNFYNFSTSKGKRFKSYSSLIKFLEDAGGEHFATEEQLKEGAMDGEYYILRT